MSGLKNILSLSIKEVRNDLSIRMIQALESILLKTEIKDKRIHIKFG